MDTYTPYQTVVVVADEIDVDEICWTQPIRSLKLGHMTGQGSTPTWVGRVPDLDVVAWLIF